MKSLLTSPLFNSEESRSLARRGCSLFDTRKQSSGIETLEARTVPASVFSAFTFDAPSEDLMLDSTGTDVDAARLAAVDEVNPTMTMKIVGTTNDSSGSKQFDRKTPDVLHGEIITYRVSFVLPEGVHRGTVLNEVFPVGEDGEMAAISGKVVRIGKGIQADPNSAGPNFASKSPAMLWDTDSNGFADSVSFEFGELTVAGTSAASRTITVEVKAQVTAAVENEPGKMLTHMATLDTENGSWQTTANAELIVKRNFARVFAGHQDGVVTMEGTELNDTLVAKVDRVSGATSVVVNGTNLIFPANTTRINVFGGDGNDSISAAKTLTIPVYFNGGNGNDKLTGGAAADMLLGGEGNDVIDGGLGNDLVIGGGGWEKLRGSGGQDILIAAQTAFDNDWQKLDAISKVWANGSSNYWQRIEQLSEGTTIGDVEVQLDASSLIADEGGNRMDGGGDLDWIIAARAPRDIYRVAPEEIVTNTGEALPSLVSTKLLRAMVAR